MCAVGAIYGSRERRQGRLEDRALLYDERRCGADQTSASIQAGQGTLIYFRQVTTGDRMGERICTIPASIAFGHPNADLLGIIPKTLMKASDVMSNILIFIAGYTVGGIVGIVVMCVLQINHDRKELKNEQSKH